MFQRIRILLLVCVIGVLACNNTPVSFRPTSTPSTSVHPLVPIVIYERSGGTTDYERWEIYASGRVIDDAGQEWYLSIGERAVLMSQVEQSGFFEMEDVYLTSGSKDEMVVYALSVQWDLGMKTVVAVEGTPEPPPTLWDLVQQIDKLVHQEM